jgi:hypothetical protein
MGFGGGGSGSFVLPNHKHTNVLADGGNLEELVSLIDGITFKAWIDAKILANAPTIDSVVNAANFSTSAGVYVDVTGMSITMPTKTNGKYMLVASLIVSTSIAVKTIYVRFVDDVTATGGLVSYVSVGGAGTQTMVSNAIVGDLSGQVVKLQVNDWGGGTVTVYGAANTKSNLRCFQA